MVYALIDLFCGVIVPLVVVLILYFRFYKDRSAGKTVLLVLFLLYIGEMFDVVGIPAISYCRWNPIINLVPFSDFGKGGFLFQTIANAVMFAPFGFLLPLMWKSFRKFWPTVLAGLLTSVCIETAQLFSARATDVDDLLMNTLGTAVGYAVIALFAGKRWKKDEAGRTADSRRDRAELLVIMGIVFLSAIFVKGSIGQAIYGFLNS